MDEKQISEKLNETQTNFLERIKAVYHEAVGYEEFGEMVEFYDESGAVLMTVSGVQDGSDDLEFKFTAGESYRYSKQSGDLPPVGVEITA